MSSSGSKTQQIRSLSDLEVVVDTDFHLTERQEDFLPYLDDPFDSLLNRETGGDDYGFLSSLFPSHGMLGPVTIGKVDNPPVRTKRQVLDGKELIEWDRAIVTPTLNLYLGGVHHHELAAALASAYNEWILDEILDPDEGIYGAAVVAPQRPAEMAEEIDDRADEEGIVAIMLPSSICNPIFGDDKYHPIYRAAEDARLPIMMHNAAGATMIRFPSQWQAMKRQLPIHVTAHPMMHMVNIADMLTQGIPERFPDLEFVIQESGLGWYPYFMRRMDHDYRAAKYDAPLLEKMPSEYLADQFYLTSQPVEGDDDPAYLQSVIEAFDGQNNLMFSSDYPHFDFDMSEEILKTIRGNFEVDEVKNIYGETAEDLFAF
ncbi:amidohydrolase [Halobacteriales archaeon QS_8_69_26]|nr:MAG: amidohydrolase [Halobacteriales archaeon QS_8_69_26]